MENKNKHIIDAFREIGGKFDFEIFTAKVVAVNESDGLIDVENNSVKYLGVRLRSIADGGKGIVIVPKNNTMVTVGKLENSNQYVLLNCSEVDKVIIDCDNIVYNGGDNDGLVKVKELKTKLNDLEKEFNKLKQVFTAWSPVSNDGGAALKAAVAVWAGTTLTLTMQNDIENTKFKH